MTQDIGVDFNGMVAAEAAYERARHGDAGVPAWSTLHPELQRFYAYFADGVVLQFLDLMNTAGIKTEAHSLPPAPKEKH